MAPEEFSGHNIVIAKDQPEYTPLPAYRIEFDPQSSTLEDCERIRHGELVFCWTLSFVERVKLLFTGRLWHTVLTFNRSLQPQRLEVDRPVHIPMESK
jgi:hypothetical protein